MQQNQIHLQIPRMGPAVKGLLIASVVTFILQLTVEKFAGFHLSAILGFVPALLSSGYIWQPFTYPFLHGGLFHLLFNMLVLWSIGSELERVWGGRFFLAYFFVCSLGAAVVYMLFSALGIGPGLLTPVVGCSGAVYGMLLAYGILFGERTLYFFMIFPMKAKYFVMILAGIVLVSSVFYSADGVAHTAHLGGMVAGLAMLLGVVWKRRAQGELSAKWETKRRQKRVQKAAHLRLIKDDPNADDDNPSRIWH